MRCHSGKNSDAAERCSVTGLVGVGCISGACEWRCYSGSNSLAVFVHVDPLQVNLEALGTIAQYQGRGPLKHQRGSASLHLVVVWFVLSQPLVCMVCRCYTHTLQIAMACVDHMHGRRTAVVVC